VAVYLATVFLIPIDPNTLEKYHVSGTQARLLNTAVVIPMIGIWFVAFYGFSRISSYAQAVRDTHEGPPFHAMAAGLLISVLGLPFASIIGAILGRYAVLHPDALPMVTIIRNYIGVMLTLLAFYLIGNGAEALARLVKGRRPRLGHPAWTIGFIICSSLFTWLITARPEGAAMEPSAYYLPDWLIVATIAVPYLYVWYRGAVAAYCIYFYQKNTKGTLYRRALGSFSAGIAVVIGASVFIQFLTTFSERVNRLNLTPILGIIYLLLVLWAVGYGLIARGAKKLKTLEDV
jgi:hypothetical protein